MHDARPEALLAQVASEVQADGDFEVVMEATEVLLAERSRSALDDRLARSRAIVVTMSDGETVAGVVRANGPGFALIEGAAATTLVRTSHAWWIEGLAQALGDEPGPVLPSATWGQVVRSYADRPVDVVLCGGRVVRGLVASSGRDHLDVLVDGRMLTIALSSITRLRQPRMDGWQRTRASGRTSG